MITELWPERRTRALSGAMLELALRPPEDRPPRIVAAFVASLDGRIALDSGQGLAVPKAAANPRDWRLFQELAAQADVVLVAGRLVRECAEGRAQAPPPPDAQGFPDLIAWRRSQGLAPMPEVWVLTSGRRPLPAEVLAAWAETRPVRVLAPVRMQLPERVAWTRLDDFRALAPLMRAQGAGLALFAAGGVLFRRILAEGLIDELFLTQRLVVLAGRPYATLAEGEALASPAGFALAGLWYDEGVRPAQLILRLRRA